MRVQRSDLSKQAGISTGLVSKSSHPAANCLFPIAAHGIRREGNNRNTRRGPVGLDPPSCLFAVDIGQGEVHENEVWLLGGRYGNALRPVGRHIQRARAGFLACRRYRHCPRRRESSCDPPSLPFDALADLATELTHRRGRSFE
jgi:hypothetical protein